MEQFADFLKGRILNQFSFTLLIFIGLHNFEMVLIALDLSAPVTFRIKEIKQHYTIEGSVGQPFVHAVVVYVLLLLVDMANRWILHYKDAWLAARLNEKHRRDDAKEAERRDRFAESDYQRKAEDAAKAHTHEREKYNNAEQALKELYEKRPDLQFFYQNAGIMGWLLSGAYDESSEDLPVENYIKRLTDAVEKFEAACSPSQREEIKNYRQWLKKSS